MRGLTLPVDAADYIDQVCESLMGGRPPMTWININ